MANNSAPSWGLGKVPSASEWASAFAGKVDASNGRADSLTATIIGGKINFTPIGADTPASGNFSSLALNGVATTSIVTNGTVSAGVTLFVGSGLALSAGGTLSATSAGALLASNNLSDVASAATARANINQGIGTLVTSGATIATDASANNAFQVSLTQGVGPYVLANPTNTRNGSSLVWHIDQPGTTATTMTFGSNFLFGAPYSNASPPPLSTLANGKSTLSCTVDNAGKLRCVMAGNDFA